MGKRVVLLGIINSILKNKGREQLVALDDAMDLRNDIGLTSLDLAELTVKIEDVEDIDIFEDGLVNTVKEVLDKLE